MGSPNTAPNWPGLVTVKVEPSTSSGLSFLLRARSPRSVMPRCRPRKLRSPAFFRTGTMSPQSSATAMPTLIVAVVADVVAFERGVDDGKLLHGDDGGAHEERHEGEADAVALLESGLLLGAQGHDAGEIHFVHAVDVSTGAARLDHALGDDLAHVGHGNEVAGIGSGSGMGGAAKRVQVTAATRFARRDGRMRPSPHWPCPTRAGCDPWRSMKAVMSCLVMRPPRPVPETCERLTPCSRAILRTRGEERASSSTSSPAEAGAGSRGGCCGGWLLLFFLFFLHWRSRRWGGFRWGGGFAIRSDGADDRIHADRCAFGDFDFLQHAGGGRGNFGVNLVGGDFEERLVALDFVSGLLQPFGDGAFDDGFAHLRHDDVSRHDSLPRGPRFRTESRMQTNHYSGWWSGACPGARLKKSHRTR